VDRHDAARHQVGDEFIEMSLLQRLDRHFAAPVAQWLQTVAVGGLGRLAQTLSAGQPVRASLLAGHRRLSFHERKLLTHRRFPISAGF